MLCRTIRAISPASAVGLLLLTSVGCSGGAPDHEARVATHPAALVGSWYRPSAYEAYRFDADGGCVFKRGGLAAVDCRYDVVTGAAAEPAPDASWIVEVRFGSDRSQVLEVVGIDRSGFSVRSGDALVSFKATDPAAVLDCGGSAVPCATLENESACNSAPGCAFDASAERCAVYGSDATSCAALDPWQCERRPGCSLK